MTDLNSAPQYANEPSNGEKEELSPDELRDFLNTAFDRFTAASEAEEENRKNALDDIKFSHGDQWPLDIWQQRIQFKRPALTINQLPKFIRQVTNETRQNKPSIQVHPVDDGADVETAEILQGLIRHIEEASDADAAYDTASDNQVRGGWGYIRVLTEYCYPDSFDQEIRIKRILNPFTVYRDPDAQEIDGSDARYCFITEDMSAAKYRSLYPDTQLASLSEYAGKGDREPWATKDNVRVAEYYCVESKTKTLCQMQDGTTVYKDELPEEFHNLIIRERETEVKKVMWYKINAIEIIDSAEIPCPWIPVVPVVGEEFDVDGKRVLKGMVRDAKDTQRMYNFNATAETEAIALSPKTPWVVAEGQMEGYEKIWADANNTPYSALPYKPTTIAGSPVPPPQRITSEPPVVALSNARRECLEDLKGITGIFDAGLGARSNETSGRAINARKAEGDTANYHFPDNLNRAIKQVGRICVAMIPHIYDAPRAIRIVGDDNIRKTVKVNQPTVVNGLQKIYDLTAGRYDVVIVAGPSFSTKRQEAAQSMLELTQAYPQLMQIAGDVMVKNMDWPGAQQIAERLKKMLPPNLQEPEEGDDSPVPPEIAGKMQEMQAMIEQLTQALNAAQDDLEGKRFDNESKERIAYLDAQVKLVTTLASLESKENQELLKAEIASVSSRLERLNQIEDAQLAEEAAEAQKGVDMGGEPMAINSQADSGVQSPATQTF